jgi:hypothetical protein
MQGGLLTSRMTLPGGNAPRAELYEKLSQAGDFRRGSLNEVRRRCSKPNCAQASRAVPGTAGTNMS